MKLSQPIIEIGKCPDSIFSYLQKYILSLDWKDLDLLTKEEAFYDQSYRYEAVTAYFNENSYFYSNLPPSKLITDGLHVYIDYLLTELFQEYEIFRCQVVCLKPGQNVYPHIDPRYYHAYGKRIHLPLKINPLSYHVHFNPLNNYDMMFSKMKEGMIIDFDNITPHSAFNYGDANRIHIITDIVKKPIIEKLKSALGGNPNATNENTIKEYYEHLRNIETRYNCNYKDLKPHYIIKMKEYD